MSLTIGYSEFRKLLKIENAGDFRFGLVLREDGVYVKPLDDLEERALVAGSREMDERTQHPTGNLNDPVLSFPCSVDALKHFVYEYQPGSIEPFTLVSVLERQAFALAQIEAKEEGNYHWPIVAGLYGLQHRLEHWHETESNDSRKVVLPAKMVFAGSHGTFLKLKSRPE